MKEECNHYLELDYGVGVWCSRPKGHLGPHQNIELNSGEMRDRIPKPEKPPFANYVEYLVSWEEVAPEPTIVVKESESQNAICN